MDGMADTLERSRSMVGFAVCFLDIPELYAEAFLSLLAKTMERGGADFQSK
jgi:hypothetical protein